MTTALRTIAFAAATAASLAAGAASAWDERLPPAGPPGAYPARAYATPVTATPPRAGHAPGSSWEARELLREYGLLDQERARFQRRWGWNPWRVARFDAWYGQRRAELDGRWAEMVRRQEESHRGWPARDAGWNRDRD
jgi:hypothetical protein